MFVMLGIVLKVKRQIALTISINQQNIEVQLGKNISQQVAESGFANPPFEGEKGDDQRLSRFESSCSIPKSTECICTVE